MRALVNYATTLFVLGRLADSPLQIAALVGITAGMSLTFLASRTFVFRRSHVRPASGSKSRFPGFFAGERSGPVLFEVAEDGLSDEAIAGPGGVVSIVGDE